MAGKKKKLSRREQRKQKRQQKNRVRHRTGWREPAVPEINHGLMEDLRPFLERPDLEKGLITLLELAADSDDLVDEPEFINLFFMPPIAFMHFVAAIEGGGLSADDYFALPEEVRSDKFFEIVEEILPQLVTEEFRETLMERAETARARFRDEGDEQKLWQTSAVQFFIEMKGDEEAYFYPGLVQMIASKSIEAGPLLIRPDEEEEDADEYDEEAAEQRLDAIPGLRDYLQEIMRAAKAKFIHELFNGDLVLGLFTGAEIEEVIRLFEEEDDYSLDALGIYLTQILTPPRRVEIAERLEAILADLPEHMAETRPFLQDMHDGLPELEPQTALWAALAAALVGEVNAYEPDE